MSEIKKPEKKRATVNGKSMAYVEAGSGDPIVFLHGNPTSSFLWRKVIPAVAGLGRCIAPDLIGMGDSDKLDDSGPDRYTFVEHREYLDGLLEQLGVNANVITVGHDWGSALLFDWANRHRKAMTGIVYMEAIVAPYKWSQMPEAGAALFRALRTEAGESMILDQNLFVEGFLVGNIQRTLDDAEMAEYRRPFAEPGESRRPTLTWPRQIPIDGEPADVTAIVEEYGAWLSSSDSPPKLFVRAEPGAIILEEQMAFCTSWPNQTAATAPGLHFMQEDSGEQIGAAIAEWIPTVR